MSSELWLLQSSKLGYNILRENYSLMKIAFHTLGCKVNSYETQAIKEQFLSRGFSETGFDEPSDVYVVNTCSVTQIAARKSRQMLHRARKLSPNALIVATGCYAQEDADALIKDSAVDMVVGNNEKSSVAELVISALENRDSAANVLSGCEENASPANVHLTDLTHCRKYESQTITGAGDYVRAYIKIQDGCNRFCSYCIIPYLRGRSRSRNAADIINEVKALSRAGYKEIILTGIDVSSYEGGLAELITECGNISGIERIRLSSLECSLITEDFMEKLSRVHQICPHFHLSLQSGSDGVLRRMNRKYTASEYMKKVRIIRKFFPEAAITTDIIVGFPGETDEEFEETLAFTEEVGFAQAHVFKYSKRKGTKAAVMPNQVKGDISSERSHRLIELTDTLQHDYAASFIGRDVYVLFEEETEDGYQVGFSPEYIKVAVKSEANLTNRVISVRLEGFMDSPEGEILYGHI